MTVLACCRWPVNGALKPARWVTASASGNDHLGESGGRAFRHLQGSGGLETCSHSEAAHEKR